MITDQIQSCAQYLHDHFNYETRMMEVSEQLALNPDALDEALVRFMGGDILSLRLTIENAAMAICERAAQKLVKAKGDLGLKFYEEVDCE